MAATKTRPQEREETGRFAAGVAQAVEKAEEIHAEPAKTRGEDALDDALWRMRQFVYAGEAETIVATLYAAATHAIDCFEAFPRVLFTSDGFGGGKTTFMMATAYLSQNPEDASGTKFALDSMLAGYQNSASERPTLYLDEVQSVFGKSGTSGAQHPLGNILRKGYKAGATEMRSVNRVAEKFSTFSGFLLAGLGTAIPADVRDRCHVLKTVKGRPQRDLDARGSERDLRITGNSLGLEVQKYRATIKALRYDDRGIEGLEFRTHQRWLPILAVAEAVGGKRWLAMALQAYHDLSKTDKSQSELSATQEVLRDLATIVTDMNLLPDEVVPAASLARALARQDRFDGWDLFNVAQEVGHAMPVLSVTQRVDGKPTRVYGVGDILSAWKSADPKNVMAEEAASSERDLDDAFPVAL